MSEKGIVILTFAIATIVVSVLYGILYLILNDSGYSPYETYGEVTIVTTKDEVRIDDTNNNSGSILMHNVLLCGKTGDYLYIIDRSNNKTILNIYTKEIKRISNDGELFEKDKAIFEALSSDDYEFFDYLDDLGYIYEN